MLHIATVHFQTARWAAIQTRQLRRHIDAPFETWTSLQGIDPSQRKYFDHVVEQQGTHAEKLNHLAIEICAQADEKDLLMFLDSDAFPVADPLPMVEAGLQEGHLVAVNRAENNAEPQPHPCFCVTRVGTWRSIPGDWSKGHVWTGKDGTRESDLGGNLLRQLELRGMRWTPIRRTSRHDLHPLFFGIYGGAIYHHGAGSRTPFARVDRVKAQPLKSARWPFVGPVVRRFDNRIRLKRKRSRVVRCNLEMSERLYEQIAADEPNWIRAVS